MDKMVEVLLVKETIEREAFEAIVGKKRRLKDSYNIKKFIIKTVLKTPSLIFKIISFSSLSFTGRDRESRVVNGLTLDSQCRFGNDKRRIFRDIIKFML